MLECDTRGASLTLCYNLVLRPRDPNQGRSGRGWRGSGNLSQFFPDTPSGWTAVASTSARSDRATSRPGDGACRGLTKSSCQNVSALRNRISHQVDADGEHRRSGWKVDGGQLFPGHNYGAALACARTTPGALVSSFEPPSYLPSLTTITCARRGACSCCSSASSVARVPQDCC